MAERGLRNDVLGMVPGLDGGRVPNALSRVVIARCGIGSSGVPGAVSESGRLRQGDEADGPGARRGRALVLTMLRGEPPKFFRSPLEINPQPAGSCAPFASPTMASSMEGARIARKATGAAVGVLPAR